MPSTIARTWALIMLSLIGCPPGVRAIVKDYDIDGTESDLAEDKKRRPIR